MQIFDPFTISYYPQRVGGKLILTSTTSISGDSLLGGTHSCSTSLSPPALDFVAVEEIQLRRGGGDPTPASTSSVVGAFSIDTRDLSLILIICISCFRDSLARQCYSVAGQCYSVAGRCYIVVALLQCRFCSSFFSLKT